jgi:hypothetical protein
VANDVTCEERRGGEASVKDLQRSNQRKYPTAEHAEAALDELVALELGAWADRPAGPKGGRPTRCFVLSESCVTYDETDETPSGSTPGAHGRESGCVTKPPPACDDTPENLLGNGVSSVSSYVTHDSEAPSRWVLKAEGVSSHTDPAEGVSSHMPPDTAHGNAWEG